MKQFINNNISLWFKKAGQDLHAMVKHRVQFYEKVKVCFIMMEVLKEGGNGTRGESN